jgi:MFS family permease
VRGESDPKTEDAASTAKRKRRLNSALAAAASASRYDTQKEPYVPTGSTMSFLRSLRDLPLTALVVVMVALFTDSFLYGVLVPLTSELHTEGESDAKLALVHGGYPLGLLAATPIFGIVSDRLGRRKPMIWGVLGQIGTASLFQFAGDAFALLLLARVLQGVAASATWTAALALVAQTYPQRRTAMMGFAMLGSNAGSVLGPLAGGYLHEWGGHYLPFLCVAVLQGVDLFLRIVFLVDPPRRPGDRPDLLGLLRVPAVLITCWVVVVGVGGWDMLEVLLPNHLKTTHGVSVGVRGLLFTIATFFYGLSASWVERTVERWGLRPTMAGGLTLMALSLPLVALAESPLVVGAALTLVSVLYAFALNPCFTELAEAVDRRGTGSYASVYAIYNLAYGAGMMGSDAAAGFLGEHTLLTAALVTALVMLASVPLLAFGRLQPESPDAAGLCDKQEP